MPHVVAAYEKYHAKGFEVVGVSLDNDRSAWLQAIDQLKMPWPQMSDLKGWESAGAALYNVHSIPANVLIDQQGKIVAKDLRGDALLKTVGDLISQ
jgi:peroxiredoxin